MRLRLEIIKGVLPQMAGHLAYQPVQIGRVLPPHLFDISVDLVFWPTHECPAAHGTFADCIPGMHNVQLGEVGQRLGTGHF